MSSSLSYKSNHLLQEAATSENVLASLSSIDLQQLTRTVDFDPDAPRAPSQLKYTISISGSFPKERDGLLCFFPTHHDEKLQVLKSDDYGRRFSLRTLADMNKDINRRLRDCYQNVATSAAEGSIVRLGIGYGDHFIKCKNLEGTVYILWATVNRKNVGNVKNTTMDCALIMNMDGWGSVKGIYILKQRIVHDNDMLLIPLLKGNPEFMWPKEDIFVCEKRPKQVKPQHLHLISKQLARQLIQAPSKDALTWLPYEKNFLSSSPEGDRMDNGTDDSEFLSEAELTDEGLSWTDTPRDIFYEEMTPRSQDQTSMKLKRTTPLVPRINYVRPTPPLLSNAAPLYKQRDPFEPDVVMKTQEEEEEARVDEAVMKGADQLLV